MPRAPAWPARSSSSRESAERVDPRAIVGIVIALVAAWALLIAVLWAIRPRDVGLRELVRLVPDILRLVRDLLADGTTPLPVRLALRGVLVWIISPIDLIPEFIPVLGPLDDVVVAGPLPPHLRPPPGGGRVP